MIDKITKDFLNKIIIEINKPDNKNNINNKIINPLFLCLLDKIYPYALCLFSIFFFNLILIIIILIILYNKKNI
jgi:hypothetical protein